MIKKYKLILIFQLLILKGYSQDTYDDIKISICGNTPIVFYEGQCLYLTSCIENLSNHEKPYHKKFVATVESFKSRSGEVIKNHFVEKMEWQTGDSYGDPEPPSIKIEPIPPHYKLSASMELRDYGNVNFTHILNIPESTYYWPDGHATLPHYLSPGEYTIRLKARLRNTNKRILTDFNFKVLPAEGEMRTQLLAYLNAYKADLHYKIEGFNIPLKQEPQLVTFLRNYPQSVYATEVFRLLTLEYDYEPKNAMVFRRNIKNLYFLFEILPTLKEYQSEATFVIFLRKFTGDIGGFVKDGLIQDSKLYVDSYLNRIQHLSPFVSEIMIEVAKDILNIDGLKNYAQEREDLERAKSNNKG